MDEASGGAREMVAIKLHRSVDKLALILLKWRCRGKTALYLARKFGVTKDFVKNTTNRIREADIAESGEAGVERFYIFVDPGRKGK